MLRFVLASLILAVCSLKTTAQTVTEPEYINQFQLLSGDGKLTPLEHETAKMETKAGGFIAVKAKVRQVVPGNKSSVRVVPTAQFVVKLNTGGMDPASMVHLYKLDTDKNSRFIVTNTASAVPFGGVKSSAATPDSIQMNIAKYGEGSLKIIPAQPLPPGEYALETAGQNADCFGVD